MEHKCENCGHNLLCDKQNDVDREAECGEWIRQKTEKELIDYYRRRARK